MIDQLMETFARHEDLAPAAEQVRRRIDAVATRRRRLRKGFVGGTAVALVALFVVAFMRLDAVSTAPQLGASAGATPLTFLLVGTDKRPWDNEPANLLRSDSIMLAHLPADRSAPYLISIPRTATGLSDVFAMDGIRALRDVLEKSTGIAIDGAVEVDFAGLVGVTDAVGGIDLCVPRRAVSEHTGRIFEPGCRRFTGEEAMDYLRQRKSFENGDVDRQLHVREYVKALYKRLGDASLREILGVIAAGGDAVRVDSGGFELAALFRTVREMKNTTVVSISSPEGGAQLWAAVRGGSLPQWVAANPKQVDQR